MQQEATRVKHKITRSNTSTTRENTSTIGHNTRTTRPITSTKEARAAKLGLYFALFFAELDIFLFS